MDLGDVEGADHEDEGGPPLLPPDDRIWRHPSELAALGEWPVPATVSRAQRRRPVARLVGGLAAGATLTTAAFLGVHGTSSPPPASSAPPGPPRIRLAGMTGSHAVAMGSSLTTTVERLTGSMVRIQVSRGTRLVQGAALALRSDGSLVTTAALVDQASAVWAVAPDGSRWVASVVGSDDISDVAVLRSPLEGLAPVPAEGVEEDDPGAMVLALIPDGNRKWSTALSFGTVVAPVINEATSPPETAPGAADTDAAASAPVVLDAIAADLPSTTGDEGAPIIDGRGSLVGLLARNPSSSQPALVLRMSVAADAANQLLATGTVSHGWLGVQGVTPAPGGGVIVSSVANDSPASAAGLSIGDAIVSADGHPVSSVADLWSSVKLKHPGEVVVLQVNHGNQVWLKPVVLGSPPSS